MSSKINSSKMESLYSATKWSSVWSSCFKTTTTKTPVARCPVSGKSNTMGGKTSFLKCTEDCRVGSYSIATGRLSRWLLNHWLPSLWWTRLSSRGHWSLARSFLTTTTTQLSSLSCLAIFVSTKIHYTWLCRVVTCLLPILLVKALNSTIRTTNLASNTARCITPLHSQPKSIHARFKSVVWTTWHIPVMFKVSRWSSRKKTITMLRALEIRRPSRRTLKGTTRAQFQEKQRTQLRSLQERYQCKSVHGTSTRHIS